MDEEIENKTDTDLSDEKDSNIDKFGKVVDALHDKQKLSSLRTYQGDMAEFIKEKNESVLSVSMKEKERKQREEKKEKEERKEIEKIETGGKVKTESGFKKNLVMTFLSLLLLLGGAAGIFYAFKTANQEPEAKVVTKKEEIIPYDNLVTLAAASGESFISAFSKVPVSEGINAINITNADGQSISKASDFFDFMEISLPPALSRTIKSSYMIGTISKNGSSANFMIITVADFGGAFSSMLDWENSMESDLSFLNSKTETIAQASTTAATASSTAAASTAAARIPMRQEIFSWKDIIVKNKDTRALINEKKKSKIAYSFLDRNTILITNDLSAIGEISSLFNSSVAR